ncbi:MAG: DUF192 domain-containing protein [Myxococcaceae bacterium]
MYSLFVACGAEGVRISFDKKASFQIEIVQKPAELEKGLMFRKSMPENAGMLFIFPSEKIQTFWMKNTLIPLDMVFMDSQKKIVGIVYNATPQTLDLRSVDKPSQYVLEINAGQALMNHLQIGSQANW